MKNKMLAIGPISASHGEAKIFQMSCEIFQKTFSTQILDHTQYKTRTISHLLTIYKLVRSYYSTDFIYCSIPRRKFLLFFYMIFFEILKRFKSKEKNIYIAYHIHDLELVKAASGFLSSCFIKLYNRTFDVTLISNINLLDGTLLSNDTKYILIHNAVPIEMVENTPITIEKSCADYLFISFPSYNKRLDKIVSLFMTKTKERLIVYGWNEKEFRKIYNFKKALPRNVIFKGSASRSSVFDVLKNAKGLVADSDSEAMPLTVCEALMLGIPCFLGKAVGYSFFHDNFLSVLRIEQLFVENASEIDILISREKAASLFSVGTYEVKLTNVFNNS